MSDEKLLHIDLFSGIGGFALAADRVFGQCEHIFCDNEPFAQEVLKKHWSDAPIFGDIRTLTHSECVGLERGGHLGDVEAEKQSVGRSTTFTIKNSSKKYGQPFILTGGFPCQPFSQAGRRRGEEDDRFLWPQMLRVIREFSPLWVIAENVRGLLTQGGGVVFERVCTDLEAAGYEVQPLVIPAVAVGAPHRRDRVWFVAYRNDTGGGASTSGTDINRTEKDEGCLKLSLVRASGQNSDAPDTERAGRGEGNRQSFGTEGGQVGERGQERDEVRADSGTSSERSTWSANWLEVATRLCRVDDELSYWVDGRGKKRNSRNPRLKALGNAIVPQVAMEIMRAML